MQKKVPILWSEEKDCCGCSACYSICPVNAITMNYNEKGFLYPTIDSEKCVVCRKCEKVCSYKSDIAQESTSDCDYIYAMKTNKLDVLNKSSSGGAFSLFSDEIISDHGAVVSALYDNNKNEVKFQLYNDYITRDKARGSKYIQANLCNVFSESVNWLKSHEGKKLLFVGTGCQVAGFEKYISAMGLRERVILIDLICHGVPSLGLWKKYCDNLEKKYKNKCTSVSFKDKRNGWMNPLAYVIIGDKKVNINGYSEWFYGGYSLRNSCFQCPYAKTNRKTDITIGDFWGIKDTIPEFYNEKGVSLLIIHTEKGKKLFDKIKCNCEYLKTDKEVCLQPRLIAPEKKPSKYDDFWFDISNKGIEYCTKKYRQESKRNNIKNKLKKCKSIIKLYLGKK